MPHECRYALRMSSVLAPAQGCSLHIERSVEDRAAMDILVSEESAVNVTDVEDVGC